MIRADTPAPRGKRKPKIGGPVNADKLEGFVARIENVEKDEKALKDSKRSIYGEAKAVGYDIKTMRWLVQERRTDAGKRAERDALRDTYVHAVGMAVDLVRDGGLSLRDAAKKAGVSKSSVHRALAVPASEGDANERDTGGGEPAGEAA